MVRSKELTLENKQYWFGWSQWQGFNEGIFGIRYALKTLSDMGFHHIALRKASGIGFGTTEYFLSHNATTLWETWWRSEDLVSECAVTNAAVLQMSHGLSFYQIEHIRLLVLAQPPHVRSFG